jgi:hypothetical protein
MRRGSTSAPRASGRSLEQIGRHAAEYWPERVKMMQSWADYLDELREGGKVLPLTRRAKKATV